MSEGLALAALIAVALLVFAGSVLATGLVFPQVSHERVRTIANIVAAGAALTIPIVVAEVAERGRSSQAHSADLARRAEIKTARDTRTLELMIASGLRLSDFAASKKALDDKLAAADNRFKYDYIDGDEQVRKVALSILDEYEAICVGVNQRLLSLPIVWAMRGDALIQTFESYSSYIRDHRTKKPGSSSAWSDCMDLVAALKPRQAEFNSQLQQRKEQQLKVLRVSEPE